MEEKDMEKIMQVAKELDLAISTRDYMTYFTNKNSKDNLPYIRINTNDDGTFYVRDTGYIMESCTTDEVIEMLRRL